MADEAEKKGGRDEPEGMMSTGSGCRKSEWTELQPLTWKNLYYTKCRTNGNDRRRGREKERDSRGWDYCRIGVSGKRFGKVTPQNMEEVV